MIQMTSPKTKCPTIPIFLSSISNRNSEVESMAHGPCPKDRWQQKQNDCGRSEIQDGGSWEPNKVDEGNRY